MDPNLNQALKPNLNQASEVPEICPLQVYSRKNKNITSGGFMILYLGGRIHHFYFYNLKNSTESKKNRRTRRQIHHLWG